MSRHDVRPLLLLELNEVCFDLIDSYLKNKPGCFPGFELLSRFRAIKTLGEERYELLEPWIQWVSVHTGKRFDEHKVFRLGDFVGSRLDQIFEIVERRGVKVGCISPMNAENRLLDPAFFIPDPWIDSEPDPSTWSKMLATSLRSLVNNNASGRLPILPVIFLSVCFIKFARIRNYAIYAKLVASSIFNKWNRALFLDLFLADVFCKLKRAKAPKFSTIFLNAAAHIQHHYMLNSEHVDGSCIGKNPSWYLRSQDDPFGDMVKVYDQILTQIIGDPGVEWIVATGLSQKPYDRVKFYYRLNDPANFLQGLGLSGVKVTQLMARDFLVTFESRVNAKSAEKVLSKITSSDGIPLFGEIDNRGDTIFVSFTYPHEISHQTVAFSNGSLMKLGDFVSFVAIKNGMHHSSGYAYFSNGLTDLAPADNSHVASLFHTIERYFK